jgi:hypothetical protein
MTSDASSMRLNIPLKPRKRLKQQPNSSMMQTHENKLGLQHEKIQNITFRKLGISALRWGEHLLY